MIPSKNTTNVELDVDRLENTVDGAQSDTEANSFRPIRQESIDDNRAGLTAIDGPSSGLKLWSADENEFWRGTRNIRRLPAGLYRCSASRGRGPSLIRQNIPTDEIIVLPDKVHDALLSEFEAFWKRKEWFVKRGFVHKRGILLYGPPGSGKTSAIQILIKNLVEKKDGVVLLVQNPVLAEDCLQMIRDIEPTRPMIAIFEDLDALVEDYGENEYLALLDGEAQVDNIVFVATSNYPERLDPRFTDRPSRFDALYLMDMPDALCRDTYLRHKEPTLTEEERRRWVADTDGFSIAHLKEVIVSVRCLGQDFPQTIKRLKGMREERPSSAERERNRVGFVRETHTRASR